MATGPSAAEFKVRTANETGPRFGVYQRQNLLDQADFSCGISCGIAYLPLDGSRLMLARYNGPSHEHGDIAYLPHIRRATATVIAAGRKPEREADPTDRYDSLDGATACLIEDFKIAGIRAERDQPRLF